MWPSTSCPLSSFTRNIVFGRASVTSPSISILSSFASLINPSLRLPWLAAATLPASRAGLRRFSAVCGDESEQRAGGLLLGVRAQQMSCIRHDSQFRLRDQAGQLATGVDGHQPGLLPVPDEPRHAQLAEPLPAVVADDRRALAERRVGRRDLLRAH